MSAHYFVEYFPVVCGTSCAARSSDQQYITGSAVSQLVVTAATISGLVIQLACVINWQIVIDCLRCGFVVVVVGWWVGVGECVRKQDCVVGPLFSRPRRPKLEDLWFRCCQQTINLYFAKEKIPLYHFSENYSLNWLILYLIDSSFSFTKGHRVLLVKTSYTLEKMVLVGCSVFLNHTNQNLSAIVC